MPRGVRTIDAAPPAIVDLVHGQAAVLDAAAALLEHRADVAIAERALTRTLGELEELTRRLGRLGYVPDDLRLLLRSPNASALRAAARRYRRLADWEAGRCRRSA